MLLLALTRAHGDLGLLGVRGNLVVGHVQAKLLLHLGDLGDRELWQLVGDLVGPLLLDVGLGEDDVDFLELTTGGFSIEEPGEGETDEVDQSKEEVDTPARGVGEHRGEHDNGEVGDPVGAGGCRRGHGSSTEGVDLGRVDPGKRQSSEGEEADEQEDTDDGTLGVLGTTSNQAAHGDDEGKALTGETDQEEVTATDLLDHEERGDGSERVDCGKDTAQHEGQLAGHTQVLLEQQGGIVDGSVATGELLEELARAADHHTLEFLSLAEGEESPPVGLGASHGLQVGLHEVVVGEHVLAIDRAVVERSQDFKGFLVVTAHDEPTGRLGQHKSTGSDADGEDNLERDRESPLNRGVDVRKTKVNPVGNEGTDGNDGTLEADEETPVVRTRTLRLPHGDGSSVHTVSETRDNTANDELTKTPVRAEGSSRDHSTENHQKATSHQQRCAANALTEHQGEDSTEETTQLVTSGDSTTEDGDMGRVALLGVAGRNRNIGRQRGELLSELGTGDDTRHQTLVITEQREADDGGEGDGQMELLAPQAGG